MNSGIGSHTPCFSLNTVSDVRSKVKKTDKDDISNNEIHYPTKMAVTSVVSVLILVSCLGKLVDTVHNNTRKTNALSDL